MKIIDFIWLENIEEKLIVKHHVTRDEVEDLLFNEPWILFVEKGHRPGENLYSALGQTASGRYLNVFFVYKRDKQALIVSARDMTRAERRRYERR